MHRGLENKIQTFDSLAHEVLITELKHYGLDQNLVKGFRSYLKNRYQCCNINNTGRDWRKIIAGVIQESVLGPLLFNIDVISNLRQDVSILSSCICD